MSVSNITDRQLYDGDDATVVFAIPFDIISDDSAEVDVYLVDSTTRAATLQTEGVDYTLTDISGDFYTNVTMTTAPTSSQKLLIIRNIALTQPLDLDESGDFPAESFETSLDRLQAQVQFLQEQINRTAKLVVGSANTNPDLPEPTNGKYLQWNSDGDLQNSDGTGSLADFDDSAPTTTKGDLITRETSQSGRLAVGSDGQYLKADSTAAGGLAWSTITDTDTTLADIDFRTKTVAIYDEFTSTNGYIYDWARRISGTGAGPVKVPVAGMPGVIDLNMGTTSTGRSGLDKDYNDMYLGGGVTHTWDTLVQVPTLSTVSEEFSFHCGMNDGITGTPSDGLYFEYDRTNSVNWYAAAANGGTRTTEDTGVAVGAGEWVWLRIISNSDCSSVTYYINGTLVATITTNLPTENSTLVSASQYLAVKSNGTTARSVYLTFNRLVLDFASSRVG